MNRKERTIFVTIIVNILLILFKFWLANASGSEALRASAVHSITDAAIGVFVLIGLFIGRWDASRSSDRQRFSQIENWIALVVAAAIFYVAYDIIIEVLSGEAPELRNLGVITIASLITVAAAYFIARYKQYVGKQTNSPALLASGAHSQMDIYAAIVVVIGLAGSALGLPNLDRAAAAVVVVFIVFSGYEIAVSAISALRRREVLEIDGEPGHQHAPNRLWRLFLPIAGVFLVIVYLLSGLYVVQPGEIGVVRRFGQVIAPDVGPGLHYRLPWPIDRVDLVETASIRRAEPTASLMLTGDQNLISVRFSLHYIVTDAAAFLLNVDDPARLVMQAGESAMRQVVAQESVDSLLTVDKAEIEERVNALAQSTLDAYNAGLQVVGIQLLESNPPTEVADAFRDVASAREDQNTFINEAQAYANEIIPVARGDAATTIQNANAYSSEKIGRANGDAALFTSQQAAYAESPDITRLRMYLVAMESVLPGVRKFILDPSIQLETTDLWFPGDSSIQSLPPLP